MLRADNLLLPRNAGEIPDVVVYLCRGKGKAMRALCYARLPAVQLLPLRFGADFRWVTLKADPAVSALAPGVYPGSVLMRIGFGRATQRRPVKLDWELGLSRALASMQDYQLRVHLFQARNLPSADDNGAADPYVVVKCCGQRQVTPVQRMTLHPVFYHTLTFEVRLVRVARAVRAACTARCSDVSAHLLALLLLLLTTSTPPVRQMRLDLAPEVIVQVWDWDRVGKNDLLGAPFSPVTPLLYTCSCAS